MKEPDRHRAVFRSLGRVVQSFLMYPEGNERQVKFARSFVADISALGTPLRMSFMGRELVVEKNTLENPGAVERQMQRLLQRAGWESIRIEENVGVEAVLEFAAALVAAKPAPITGYGYKAGFLTFQSADSVDSPVSETVKGYISLLGTARDSIAHMAEGNPHGLAMARDIVSGFAAQLAEGKDLFGPLRNLKHFDEYTFTHGLNVAILTLAVGRAMAIPFETAENMATAALCHDVGKERVPKDILHKPSRLTDSEMDVMKRHPAIGADLLIKLDPKIKPIIPVVAFEHHMGFTGEGYPAPFHGHRAHPVSNLVSIADTYDALRTTRPYQQSRSNCEAFSIILSLARQGKYDKRLLPAFAGVTGVARKGRMVRLTNNKEARIVAENQGNPLRPAVVDGEGNLIDLEEARSLGIVGIFEPEADLGV